MKDLSRCHKTAVKEVVSAISMLRDRKGSLASDIYFVLDNFHGKVQRHVIQHALTSAVAKGLLNCKNNRYKVRKQKKSPFNIPHGLKSSSRKTKPSRNYGFVSDSAAQHFECRMNNRDRSRKSYATSKTKRSYRSKSYRFREVSRPLKCDCMTSTSEETCETCVSTAQSSGSSLMDSQREITSRQSKKRCPVHKNVKVEKKILPEVNTHTSTEAGEDIQTDIKQKMTTNCDGRVETKSRAKEIVAVKKSDNCNENQSTTGGVDTKSVKSNRSKFTAEKPGGSRNIDISKTSDKNSCSNVTPSTSQKSKLLDKSGNEDAEADHDKSGNKSHCSKCKSCKNVKDEHKYQTRSKTRAEKRKRPSSSSSIGTKTSNKKLKENLPKSVKEEDCKSQGTSYEHIYS